MTIAFPKNFEHVKNVQENKRKIKQLLLFECVFRLEKSV